MPCSLGDMSMKREETHMSESIWPTIHAERAALPADLGDLSAEQWAGPSLCSDWTIHQVLAHQLSAAEDDAAPVRRPGSPALASTSPSSPTSRWHSRAPAVRRRPWPRSNSPPAARRRRPARRTPGSVRRSCTARTSAARSASSATIRCPRSPAPCGSTRAATRSSAARRGWQGLTFKATDTDLSIGSGPLVEGPVMSLLLASTGRKSALDDLSGDGVELPARSLIGRSGRAAVLSGPEPSWAVLSPSPRLFRLCTFYVVTDINRALGVTFGLSSTALSSCRSERTAPIEPRLPATGAGAH